MPRSAQAIDDAPRELPRLNGIRYDSCHGDYQVDTMQASS
jgi:hypothetical protein